jgi:hypothetical protein
MTRILAMATLALGGIGLLIGAVTLAQTLAAEEPLQAIVLRLRAATLLGGGLGTMVLGAALLVLDDLRRDLRDLREDLMRARRSRPAARAGGQPRQGGPAVAWGAATLPPRIELVTRYGEQTGGRAWEIMRQARRDGAPVSESEAVARARAEHG